MILHQFVKQINKQTGFGKYLVVYKTQIGWFNVHKPFNPKNVIVYYVSLISSDYNTRFLTVPLES